MKLKKQMKFKEIEDILMTMNTNKTVVEYLFQRDKITTRDKGY